MSGRKIIISCEHAGNYIPISYRMMFAGAEALLNSHKGWDPGALSVAKYLARRLGATLFTQKVSRLLVETNRSVGSKELFSEYTANIDKSIQSDLLSKYYYPYRNEVEQKINQYLSEGYKVLHLSVHSFTPVLKGIVRVIDVGLLYDAISIEESSFCESWKNHLDLALEGYVVMLNCPYNGADDGFATYLRSKFSDHQYMGIELEINQKHIENGGLAKIKEALVATLQSQESIQAI